MVVGGAVAPRWHDCHRFCSLVFAVINADYASLNEVWLARPLIVSLAEYAEGAEVSHAGDKEALERAEVRLMGIRRRAQRRLAR